MTEVFIEDLDALVSHLDDRDGLERMRSAALGGDQVIERRAMPRRE